MNKIISIAILLGLLISLLVPLVILAQIETCTLREDMPDIHQDCLTTIDVGYGLGVMPIDDYGQCCLFNSVYVLTDWLGFIILGIVALVIIYGAILFTTAGGEPEKVTKARNYILYAVVGFLAFLFSKAIPSIAKAILGI